MRKILDGLTIFSFAVVVLGVGAGTYSYFWLKNPKNIENVKQKVIDSVMDGMNIPSVPSVTGGAIPKAAPNAGFSIPKF